MTLRGKFNFMVLLFVILATPVAAYNVLKDDAPPKILKSDLGITFDEFRMSYNQNAILNDAPILKNKNFRFSPNGDFEYEFDPEFKIYGKINSQTGKISQMIISCSILNTMTYKTTFKLSSMIFSVVVQTLSPEINSSERDKMIESFYSVSNSAKVKGRIRYSKKLILDDDESLIFIAEPKN